MNESMISLLLVVGVLLLIVVLIANFSKPRLNKNYFTKHWEQLQRESNLETALIKADSLLDEALKHARIKGDTMGERLNSGAGFLRDINGTWTAHKLRNRVVHEPDAKVSKAEVEQALKQLKKALKDIGAL